MKFRTELSPDPIQPALQYSDQIMVLGSCFAEHIGHRIARSGMTVMQNPLGIQYNPKSLRQVMAYLCGERPFERSDIFEHMGRFRHWDLHSTLCGHSAQETFEQAQNAITQGHEFLKSAQWLYLTVGSAHAWNRDGRTVANCHKMPSSEFQRVRLSIEECETSLTALVQMARRLNPSLHVVLTVSPVRYKRDGLIESQRSKSTLLLAVDRVCQALTNVHYFPAYELVIDDLRDYRFMDSDLVHPNGMAIDYIWHKFQQCAVSTSALHSLKAGEKEWKRHQHRSQNQPSKPIDPSST